MPGVHPFDFISFTTSQLSADVHEPAAQNIARLVAHIEQHQLRVSVHRDLRSAAEVWRSEPKNGPISVLADPDLQHPLPEDSALSLVLTRHGVPVGCIVQRHIWVMNLVKSMQDLTYWFPGVPAPSGVRCMVEPSDLRRIIDCWTVYSCALYVRHDASKPDMQSALVRLSHALCAVHWQWTWLIGRARSTVAGRYPFRAWGAENVTTGVFLLGPGTVVDQHYPHFAATVSRAAFHRQLMHPDYGDPAKPIDLPPALRPAAAE